MEKKDYIKKTPRNRRFFLLSSVQTEKTEGIILQSEKTEGIVFQTEKGEGVFFFNPKKLRVLRGLEPKKPRVLKAPKTHAKPELAAFFLPFALFIFQRFLILLSYNHARSVRQDRPKRTVGFVLVILVNLMIK